MFGDIKFMHKIPTDLVGFFFRIQQIVVFFDPLVDYLIKHDAVYDAEMTELLMNTLDVLDQELATAIARVLNLDNPDSNAHAEIGNLV